jgi:chromosome segregation ATPase
LQTKLKELNAEWKEKVQEVQDLEEILADKNSQIVKGKDNKINKLKNEKEQLTEK